MTSLESIEVELQDITARLTEAVEKIDHGITLDLSDLGPRTNALCERVLALPPADALSMLTRLHAAVEQLDQIHSKLSST